MQRICCIVEIQSIMYTIRFVLAYACTRTHLSISYCSYLRQPMYVSSYLYISISLCSYSSILVYKHKCDQCCLINEVQSCCMTVLGYILIRCHCRSTATSDIKLSPIDSIPLISRPLTTTFQSPLQFFKPKNIIFERRGRNLIQRCLGIQTSRVKLLSISCRRLICNKKFIYRFTAEIGMHNVMF